MESLTIKKGLINPANHRLTTETTSTKTLVIEDGYKVVFVVWGFNSKRTHKLAINYIEGTRDAGNIRNNSTISNSGNIVDMSALSKYGSLER